MEAYSDSFYTTGVTYQADNQPTPTTIKGAGVDVSTLNIIGLGGTVDWGVHAYDPTGANGIDPRNGGIVGSISYDTTRNELDPQYAAAEDWQPGVPGRPGQALRDGGLRHARRRTRATRTTATSSTPTAPTSRASCSTPTCRRTGSGPTGCTARDVDGVPAGARRRRGRPGPDQETDGECIPAFSQSVQFGTYPTDQGTPGRELRCDRQRQLRLRRRLLQRDPRRHRPGQPGRAPAARFTAAPRG